MTFKPVLLAAMLALASLSACGGGSSLPNNDRVWVSYTYDGPTVLAKTDLVLGTGAEALVGKSVTVKLTQWSYSATAPGFKGVQYDNGVAPLPPYTFTLALAAAPGLADAVLGMKVGGKRNAVIPGDMSRGEWVDPRASMVPRLQAQVADIELISVN